MTYGRCAASLRVRLTSLAITSLSARAPKYAPAPIESAPAAVEASAARTICVWSETAPLSPARTPAVVSTPSCAPKTISRTLESRSNSRRFSPGFDKAKGDSEFPVGWPEAAARRPIGGAQAVAAQCLDDAQRFANAASDVNRARF